MVTLTLFFLLLLLGFPVAMTLLSGSVALMLEYDLQVLSGAFSINLYGSLQKSGLLAIPMFMLAGELMNRGGLTKRLISAADVLVGSMKGGMAYVNLLTNAMAAAILGSAVAQISVMSKMMIPQMQQRGYKGGFAAAVTAAGGLMGPIIPPSMLMIIYGVIAYQPIAALFVAGILPGIIILLLLSLTVFLIGLFSDLPRGEKKNFRQAMSQLASGLLPGSVPVVVIVGIVSGAVSPTESAALASIIALLLGFFVYRDMRLADIPQILFSVAMTTAVITCLIAAACTFGSVLSYAGIPDKLVEGMLAMTNSPLTFLLMINLALIVAGMFLETISVMIIVVPILMPAVETLHIDPIHFGVVVSLGTVLGLITPPVGPGLYVAMVMADLDIKEIVLWIIPFILAMFAAMVIIAVFPEISTWLPNLLELV